MAVLIPDIPSSLPEELTSASRLSVLPIVMGAAVPEHMLQVTGARSNSVPEEIMAVMLLPVNLDCTVIIVATRLVIAFTRT